MILHKVRVNSRQELDAWLSSNIPPDQATGEVRVICPDKTAKDSSLLSELRRRGWCIDIREWDYDSEGDPRAMFYWLSGHLITVQGCLELLGDNEAFAKDQIFQTALKEARRAMPVMQKLFAKLLENSH